MGWRIMGMGERIGLVSRGDIRTKRLVVAAFKDLNGRGRSARSFSRAAAAIMFLALGAPAEAGIASSPWGTRDGQDVRLYTLANNSGIVARITNYGGIVVSIMAPDRNGTPTDVVQGFDQLSDYDADARRGAIIGRYSNLKNDTYQLDGATYHVTREGKPYNERVWAARMQDGPEPQLILSLIDPAGSMGFPGTVKVTVTYTLTKANILRLDYRATTDKPTIVNLTNHSYFNMAGAGTVLDQLLTLNADAVTPGDERGRPNGELRQVAGTPFDYRKPTAIGLQIDAPDPLLQRSHGYDINFVINGAPGTLRLAARLEDPKSGRVLEEWTTQPGVQLYSSNANPKGPAAAKGYAQHSAIALEAEHAPNAPNIPSFASPEITPAKQLHEVTEFRFLVDGNILK
jgi:aldose 1-epimerase